MFRALPILGLSMSAVASEVWRPMLVSALMFAGVEALRGALDGLWTPLLFATLVVAGAAIYCGGIWLVNRTASVEALTLLFPTRFAGLRVETSPAAARPRGT
jgi:hypothetical protein